MNSIMLSVQISQVAAEIQELENQIEQKKITLVKLLGIDTTEIDDVIQKGNLQNNGEEEVSVKRRPPSKMRHNEKDDLIIKILKKEGAISPIELKERVQKKIGTALGLHMKIKKLTLEKNGQLVLRSEYK